MQGYGSHETNSNVSLPPPRAGGAAASKVKHVLTGTVMVTKEI